MSLSTYGELLNSINNWLARTDLDASSTVAPDLIVLCERELKNRLRLKEMETRLQFQIASEFSSLPTDFLEARELKILTQEASAMEYVEPHVLDFQYNRGEQGQSFLFTIRNIELQVNKTPSIVASQTVSSATRVGTIVTVTTATAHNLSVGNSITFSGANETAYNGVFILTATTSTTFTYTALSVPTASPATGALSYLVNNAELTYTAFPTALSFNTSISVTGITSVSTTCTVTTTAHGLSVGDTIVISGANETAYNGSFLVTSTPLLTTFTYTALSAPSASPATGILLLSIGTATNLILTNYPDIYLFGSLKQALLYVQNTEQLQVFGQRFEQALEQAHTFRSTATITGSPLAMRFT